MQSILSYGRGGSRDSAATMEESVLQWLMTFVHDICIAYDHYHSLTKVSQSLDPPLHGKYKNLHIREIFRK